MTKRGQNEGTIHKRADGRWVAAISLGWQDGKRKRKYFYGATRREVQERLTTALRDHQRNLPIPSDRLTVGQFLDRWLEAAKSAQQASTYGQYESHVRIHIDPALGRIGLVKLGPIDVQRMLDAKIAGGLSPRTVQGIRATLRAALGRAVKWGIVARNVAALVDPPRVEDQTRSMLSIEETRAFLAAVKGDRHEALYTVAIALGLRQGEALGLKWPDVDFDAKTLRVQRALQRIDGRLQFKEPKTKASRRTISMPDTAVRALRDHRRRQLEERLLAGAKWEEHDLVFPSRRGTPYEASELREQFGKLLKRSGLRHMRFHDLRHCCATLLLAQGVPARVVMDILGHTQISTTMNLYSHVLPSVQRDAMDQMDIALGSNS